MAKKKTTRKTTKRKTGTRVTKVVTKRRGKTTPKADKKRHALKAGKRKTAKGSTYWETRKNRSDAGGKRAKLGTTKAV